MVPHLQKQGIQALGWPRRLHCSDPSFLINKMRGLAQLFSEALGLLGQQGVVWRVVWNGLFSPYLVHGHSWLEVLCYVLQVASNRAYASSSKMGR